MNICVPIKQVPETGAVRMDDRTGTMIREGVEAIVNPLDLYAIELALMLRQRHGGRVQAVTMGPPKADKAIREAISMGCDGGVLVSDAAFAGSDTWATSRVIAAAIAKMGPFDLVICGERATDGDTGQVGPGLAAFADMPVVTYVTKVRSVGQGVIELERLVEDGREIIEMDLPGVITVVKEIGTPRLPTLRGKQRAKAAVVERWGLSDLGLSPDEVGLNGSPTRVVKIFRPKVTRQCEKLVASDESAIEAAVGRVVQLLQDKHLLDGKSGNRP